AIAAGASQGETAGDRIAEPATSRERGIQRVVTAVGKASACRGFESRRGRRDQNRAARRIATEQRALRPLENLDVLHVVELDVVGETARPHDAVDIGGDVR